MNMHSSEDQKNNFTEHMEQSIPHSSDAASATAENDHENQNGKGENDIDISTAALEKEIASLKDQVLRALADADNVRKRSIKEKEDISKYAVSDFSRSLLGVADNLRRALESSHSLNDQKDTVSTNQIDGIIAGIEMTEKELNTVFEKYGICKISPKGEKFDPHAHQAVMEVESDEESGIIVDVLQAGYMLHDRVLRPAMVSVAKKRA